MTRRIRLGPRPPVAVKYFMQPCRSERVNPSDSRESGRKSGRRIVNIDPTKFPEIVATMQGKSLGPKPADFDICARRLGCRAETHNYPNWASHIVDYVPIAGTLAEVAISYGKLASCSRLAFPHKTGQSLRSFLIVPRLLELHR